MKQIRKDYFLDEWVIFSEKRSKRPMLNKVHSEIVSEKSTDKKCFFCPGNERATGREILRIGNSKEWTIRVVKNKYPVVDSKKTRIQVTRREFFNSLDAYGYHEVIIDSNVHNKNLEDFHVNHIKDLISVFVSRIVTLSKDKKIKYVGIFKNHKRDGAASIPHSHCQLIAYNHFPERICEEVKAFKKLRKCGYCKIIGIEMTGPRICYVNKTFLALAPFASRFAYEVVIVPRRHVSSIIEINKSEMYDLADIIKKTLTKLKTINAAYNLYIHNFSKKSKLHLHIKIAPRINEWGGFEFETGTMINTVYPEKAARFYRK